LEPLEIVAGDAPELPTPRGEPGDQRQRSEDADRTNNPCLGHPQQRRNELVAPVQGGRERLHPREATGAALHGDWLVAFDPAESPFALAEQLEFVRVMLLDGGAVADADQNGVR
jgi:hypothetical protein